MKTKTLESQKQMKETVLASNSLPWWAVMALAQRSPDSVILNHFRHIHHCGSCDCIIQCHHKECQNPTMYCPDCETKNLISHKGESRP